MLTKTCHEFTLEMHTDGQQVTYYRNVVYLYTYSSDNYLISVDWKSWTAILANFGYRKGQHIFRIIKVSSIPRWKGSIQHKLSTDYSLSIRFLHQILCTDGLSFSLYKPLQNLNLWKVGNMQFSFKNCIHILTRTKGEKFEDMFLVKIVNKATSLTLFRPGGSLGTPPPKVFVHNSQSFWDNSFEIWWLFLKFIGKSSKILKFSKFAAMITWYENN